MSDASDTILRDYPSFAFLLNDPEIGPLLLQAIGPNQGFDFATFQAKIMQTNWWKTSSASQRQWETLLATDPATANQQADQWKQTLKAEAEQAGVSLTDPQVEYLTAFYLPKGVAANDQQILRNITSLYQDQPSQRTGVGSNDRWRQGLIDEATKLGVNLNGDQITYLTNMYLKTGVAPNDPSVLKSLRDLYDTQPGIRTGVGSIDTVKQQMQDIAHAYMRDLTQSDVDQWASKIASGELDINSFQTMVRNQARVDFPFYFEEINSGITPDQLFSQQRNAIANELEVDPSQIDLLHDARYSQVLGVPDASGKVRPMTRQEAIMLARKQPEWANTAGAKAQGATLTDTILKTFGRVA
jgi:hypothetical protein